MAVKDANGHTLNPGDTVHVKVGTDWHYGILRDIKHGGTILPLSKDQSAISATKIFVEITAVSIVDPRNPIALDIMKLEQPEKPNVTDTVSETAMDHP